jgi:general secretion pathway protein A
MAVYCNFYGFSEAPFGNTADPKFLYLNSCYREALAALLYGIHQRKGLVSLIGEVGSGKTTLLKSLLSQLDENTKTVFLFYTDLLFDELLMMMLVDLGLAEPIILVPRWKAINMLQAYAIQQLRDGGNVVLLVDEAQGLSQELLEGLRLLQNLETEKRKLIQVVLSGQQELGVKLAQPELRQLAQRISIRRYIEALTEEETYAYISHRCKLVGYSDVQLFSTRALKFIWRHCEGIPRRINTLCDNALLIGYALQREIIDEKIVAEAAGDCQENILKKPLKLNRGANPIQGIPSGKRVYWSIAVGLAIASITAVSFHQWIGGRIGEWANQREADAATVLPMSVNRGVDEDIKSLEKVSLEPQSSPPKELDEEPVKYPIGISSDTNTQPFFPLSSAISSQIAPQTDSEQRKKEMPAAGKVLKKARKEPRDTTKLVIVEKTDTLEKIIKQQYGTVNLELLITVLQANPEIQNPDRIRVGQVIKLPLHINNLIGDAEKAMPLK